MTIREHDAACKVFRDNRQPGEPSRCTCAAPHPSDSEPRICPDCKEPIIGVSHWHDPSDSERTPRTKAIEYALSLMKEHQRTAAPYHAVAIQRHMDALAIEAESERVSLDVERLARAMTGIVWVDRGYTIRFTADDAERLAAEYARLSPSTGKSAQWPEAALRTPEEPNQDAGGIPYWPEGAK